MCAVTFLFFLEREEQWQGIYQHHQNQERPGDGVWMSLQVSNPWNELVN